MVQERKVILDTIAVIQETTELFYQQKQQEGLAKMQDTVAAIVNMVDVLHNVQDDEFQYDEALVAKSLTEAMEAMEKGDYVLLADILEYDFVEYLQDAADSID